MLPRCSLFCVVIRLMIGGFFVWWCYIQCCEKRLCRSMSTRKEDCLRGFYQSKWVSHLSLFISLPFLPAIHPSICRLPWEIQLMDPSGSIYRVGYERPAKFGSQSKGVRSRVSRHAPPSPCREFIRAKAELSLAVCVKPLRPATSPGICRVSLSFYLLLFLTWWHEHSAHNRLSFSHHNFFSFASIHPSILSFSLLYITSDNHRV